jgi:hypothetical protein
VQENDEVEPQRVYRIKHLYPNSMGISRYTSYRSIFVLEPHNQLETKGPDGSLKLLHCEASLDLSLYERTHTANQANRKNTAGGDSQKL